MSGPADPRRTGSLPATTDGGKVHALKVLLQAADDDEPDEQAYLAVVQARAKVSVDVGGWVRACACVVCLRVCVHARM